MTIADLFKARGYYPATTGRLPAASARRSSAERDGADDSAVVGGPQAGLGPLATIVTRHERVGRLQLGPREHVVDGVGELEGRVEHVRIAAALHRAIVLEPGLLEHLEG